MYHLGTDSGNFGSIVLDIDSGNFGRIVPDIGSDIDFDTAQSNSQAGIRIRVLAAAAASAASKNPRMTASWTLGSRGGEEKYSMNIVGDAQTCTHRRCAETPVHLRMPKTSLRLILAVGRGLLGTNGWNKKLWNTATCGILYPSG